MLPYSAKKLHEQGHEIRADHAKARYLLARLLWPEHGKGLEEAKREAKEYFKSEDVPSLVSRLERESEASDWSLREYQKGKARVDREHEKEKTR